MKYNPKINEAMVGRCGIANLHPAQSTASVQGALRIYRTLEQYLAEIGGMAEFTLNPFAGAHGEYCGLMVIKAYHLSRGDDARTKVIVPVSAHGTNPASAAMAGFEIVEVECLSDGTVDIDDFRSKLDDAVAAVMLTNPEHGGHVREKYSADSRSSACRRCAAVLRRSKPQPYAWRSSSRRHGFRCDAHQFAQNVLYSSWRWRPGAGPVGVRKRSWKHFCLTRGVVECADGTLDVADGEYGFGRLGAWLGNFAVYVKALAYILTMGT